MLELSLCGNGSLTLLVSRFREELPLAELVSKDELVLVSMDMDSLSVPLWPVAEAPVPVVSVTVVSVAPISSVSLRAQPAKQIKLAAINANFFIFNSLFLPANPGGACLPRRRNSLARNKPHALRAILKVEKVGS